VATALADAETQAAAYDALGTTVFAKPDDATTHSAVLLPPPALAATAPAQTSWGRSPGGSPSLCPALLHFPHPLPTSVPPPGHRERIDR
jgi:hypothetical protein